MDIMELEKLASEVVEAHVDLNVVHTFSEGIYLRELHIPKDTLLVGKRHRGKTINMLIKGEMTIYDGVDSIRIKAPYTAESDALTKKVGYAHEDSIWVNVHKTDTEDLDEIEKKVIITEEEYLALPKEKTCHGHL